MAEQSDNVIPAVLSTVARRPCRACRCPLLFAPNLHTGGVIPLDDRADPYFILDDGRGGLCVDAASGFLPALSRGLAANPSAAAALLAGVRGVRNTHNQTCPEAGQFGKKGRIDAAHRRLMADTLRRVADRLSGPGRTAGPAECDELARMCRAAADNK